jgi:hypothetical protein
VTPLPRVATCATIAGAALVIPALARADALEDLSRGILYINPGVVGSWAQDREAARGAGFELSAGYWLPWHTPTILAKSPTIDPFRHVHLGGFFRAQAYGGASSGDYSRITAGTQLGYDLLGVELGPAVLTGAQKGRAGLHVAPFLSIGALYVSAQLLVPSGPPTPGGWELNVGLKIPLGFFAGLASLAGLGGMTAGGRPIDVDGERRVARAVRRADWC